MFQYLPSASWRPRKSVVWSQLESEGLRTWGAEGVNLSARKKKNDIALHARREGNKSFFPLLFALFRPQHTRWHHTGWWGPPTCQHPLGHRKRKRIPEKHLFLLYWLFQSLCLCVDHNKLWKILKEVEIPDHLSCLLRNLYAGQEATVRTGHGTTDWFQIGKGVCQGCILYIAYLTYM